MNRGYGTEADNGYLTEVDGLSFVGVGVDEEGTKCLVFQRPKDLPSPLLYRPYDPKALSPTELELYLAYREHYDRLGVAAHAQSTLGTSRHALVADPEGFYEGIGKIREVTYWPGLGDGKASIRPLQVIPRYYSGPRP